MRRLLVLAWLLLWAVPAYATITINGSSQDNDVSPTGTMNWDHATTGDTAGLAVIIIQGDGSATDEVTSVTADGVALTEVSCSPELRNSTEDGGVYVFVLLSAAEINGGADETQSIEVLVSGATKKRAWALSWTSTTGATEIVGCDSVNGSALDPSSTVTLSSRTSFVFEGIYWSGQNATDVDVLTNWSQQGNENDFVNSIGSMFTYDVVSTADVTYGFGSSGLTDGYAIMGVAISETVGGGGSATSKNLSALGVGE